MSENNKLLILDKMRGGRNTSASGLIAAGTALGATIGTAVPVVGTVIGGAIGGGVGAVIALFK